MGTPLQIASRVEFQPLCVHNAPTAACGRCDITIHRIENKMVDSSNDWYCYLSQHMPTVSSMSPFNVSTVMPQDRVSSMHIGRLGMLNLFLKIVLVLLCARIFRDQNKELLVLVKEVQDEKIPSSGSD